MRDFNPVRFGPRNEMPASKTIPYGEFETTRTFTYPRSYYLSIKPTISTIYRSNLNFLPRGSEEGLYEWIESAFDTAHITKSGEVHAQDFETESKSVRKFTTVRARLNRPASSSDDNESWEKGSTISKK